MKRTLYLLAVVFFAVACGTTTQNNQTDVVATGPIATVSLETSVPAAPAAATELSDELEPASDPTARAVIFPYGADPDQFGWLRTSAKIDDGDAAPVVVLIHGGFWSEPWDYTLMTPLEQSLLDAGYATWNIEFRRVGGRGGWPETFDDVSAAIDELASLSGTYPLDLDRVTLIGHSSGGHLALRALDRPDAIVHAANAIGLAAVTDLELTAPAVSFLGGTIDDIPAVYEQAAAVLDADRAVLIHGEEDSIVPPANLRTALDAGMPVFVLPDQDHFDAIDPGSDMWLRTLQVLNSVNSGETR